MTKTSDELIYEVAGILGIAVPGEAIGSAEYDVIKGQIDPVLSELQDIVYLGDIEAIPERYFGILAQIIAVHAQPKFGNTALAPDDLTRLENRLRYLVAQPSPPETMKSVYF